MMMRLTASARAAAASTTTAERQFLGAMATGCSSPVAAHAISRGGKIVLTGVLTSADGSRRLRLTEEDRDPVRLGRSLAMQALRRNADDLF